MKTWDDYKKHVKEVDPEMGHEINKIEENTKIISALLKRRKGNLPTLDAEPGDLPEEVSKYIKKYWH